MGQPHFEPVSAGRFREYRERFATTPQKVSDYSFANIWGWAEHYGLEWSWGQTCVFIRQTKPRLLYWAPVGPWHGPDWTMCPHVTTINEFTRVPEELALLWKAQMGDRCVLEEARGHWDYVYRVEDLAELKGNKFHRKKNQVNQFRKNYLFEYRDLTTDCIEETLDMQHEWIKWQELEDSAPLLAENQAIARVLQGWDRFDMLLGGALRINDEMVAYTVAEPLTDDTLVIHFEKGKPGVKGVYQAINQMFLHEAGARYALVNREQDLDDEGLRKAKMSYYPDHFMKKYNVRIL
ncbi:MAG: DUF2156 domain-containing protein [Desulfovibrionaceae bacterium]